MSKKHMGSGIDDFLKEEGIFEEARAQAVKEVVAWQLAQAMKKKISKSRMAELLTGRPPARSEKRRYALKPAAGSSHGGAPSNSGVGLRGTCARMRWIGGRVMLPWARQNAVALCSLILSIRSLTTSALALILHYKMVAQSLCLSNSAALDLKNIHDL
jgi:hypothetical protein